MKKRTKLTKVDVNTICEMQRKIDFYERFIQEIAAMCLSKKVQFILEDKYSSGETGDIYKFVRNKIEEEHKNEKGDKI